METQRIMGMRVTQDGKIPPFGEPMPLKQREDREGQKKGETIWVAQQGGLATIVRPDMLAHWAEVADSFHYLVGARRMEHTFISCHGGD